MPQSADRKLTKFDAEVLKDFRMSFRFSQGSPSLQDILILDRARKHTPEERQKILRRATRLNDQVNRMTIPVAHSQGDQDEIIVLDMLTQFPSHFGTYSGCLDNLESNTTLGISWTDTDLDSFNALNTADLHEQILLRMLERETLYIYRGRPIV